MRLPLSGEIDKLECCMLLAMNPTVQKMSHLFMTIKYQYQTSKFSQIDLEEIKIFYISMA